MEKEKILLIGDLLLDITYYVNVKKISPEAPIPVAMESNLPILTSLGGAGLGAMYAKKYNIPVTLSCLCSNDTRKIIENYEIDYIPVEIDRNITKIRYIDIKSNYHLLRVDNDELIDKSLISNKTLINNIVNSVKNFIDNNKVKVILLSDYDKRFFKNKGIVKKIIDIALDSDIPVYVDSRANNIEKFKNSTIIKLNDKELENAYTVFNTENPYKIKEKLNLEALIITHGANGATVYSDNDKIGIQPNLSKYHKTPDVTGCGDVFDILFCYNHFLKNFNYKESLKESVDKATDFAYEDIKERLI